MSRSENKPEKEKIMLDFKRSKKTILTVVVMTALCLVLSSFLPITYSQTDKNFVLPCTVNTTGNAWNGEIAFDLEIGSSFVGTEANSNYFVVMDTNGTVVAVRQSDNSYGAAYNISPDTMMFEGEPEVDGAQDAPTYETHFWNLSTGAIEDFPGVVGEHDIEYDPVNNTFLTLQQYVQPVGNDLYLVDKIVELEPNGTALWTWNSYNHIPISEASPFNETTTLNGQTVIDFIHANSLDWDYNDGIIYLNSRSTDTFYKINQTTGDIFWACGRFGNFTLLGDNDQTVSSLFYGEHDVKEVAPDVFTMFNNDYDNVTNPDDCRSSLMEVTLNETSMTAYVNWSWEAPISNWNSYAGANLLLPNGDFLGDFGDPTHYDTQNELPNGTWNFTNTGAVFVEVNPAGQVVRTWTFPVGCYVYRVETVSNLTSVTASTPSVLPTSSPSISISSETIIASVVIASAIAVVAVLAVFYLRKRTNDHKIDDSPDVSRSKTLSYTPAFRSFSFFSRFY